MSSIPRVNIKIDPLRDLYSVKYASSGKHVLSSYNFCSFTNIRVKEKVKNRPIKHCLHT